MSYVSCTEQSMTLSARPSRSTIGGFGKHTSDAQLVAAYQAGDEAAFTAIYERYAPLLRQYAYRRVGDREFAADLVQEAMLKAARYIPHGTIHDLDGYLILCVRQMWWRRVEQSGRKPEEWPLDALRAYRRYGGDVEIVIEERETVAEVLTLLAKLPDDDRTIAVMKLFYGYDLRGAAEALGWALSRARAAWKRCWHRFRAWGAGKEGRKALDHALIAMTWTDAGVPVEAQCRVTGCYRARHAYERCAYHAEAMLARRRQLAAGRQG